MNFSILNWIILAIVLIGTTIIGEKIKGKGDGVDDFFRGGRNCRGGLSRRLCHKDECGDIMPCQRLYSRWRYELYSDDHRFYPR